MPGVTGCLFQEMRQDPPQVDWRLIVELRTDCIEAGGIPYHGVGFKPNLVVADDRIVER